MVGDNHIKRVRRNDFYKELPYDKAFFRSFIGENVKQLRHYIISTLINDKHNAIVIHVGANDILNHANHGNITRSIIINVGLNCENNGVSQMFI